MNKKETIEKAEFVTDYLTKLYKEGRWTNEKDYDNGKSTYANRDISYVDTEGHKHKKKMYKATYKFDTPAKDLFESIVPYGPHRLKYDTTLTKCEVLKTFLNKEDLKDNKKVKSNVLNTYCATSAYGPISSRDFVDMVVTRHKIKDDVVANIAMGVEGKEEVEGYVRGRNHPCGLVVEDLPNENCSKLILYFCTDIKGNIPQFIVNANLSSNQADLINKLVHYIENSDFPKYTPGTLAGDKDDLLD